MLRAKRVHRDDILSSHDPVNINTNCNPYSNHNFNPWMENSLEQIQLFIHVDGKYLYNILGNLSLHDTDANAYGHEYTIKLPVFCCEEFLIISRLWLWRATTIGC